MATQQPSYQRLAQQQALGDGNGEAFFQCVIVGSGYGGAVMAAHLSPHFAPGQLAVLERGKEYQPDDYPNNLREAVRAIRTARQPLGMYDFTLNTDMDALTANALGGGSNICANVMLEPWPEVFNTWPMAWQDLAIAVQTEPTDGPGGLAGVIKAGKILIGGLATEPLVVKQGEFALLPSTVQRERSMRYQLHCQAQDGQRFLLYGFKCLSNSRGRFLPLTVWRETTTLYVAICALDEQDAPTAVVATGIMHIHPLNLFRQLLTMRSCGVAGQVAHLRNLASFGRFFAAGLAAVYWKK